jgi:excisionase family DNA binding protein
VSQTLGFEFEGLLDQLVERIARRLDELSLEHHAVEHECASPWMGIAQAAEYLDWPRQRLYKLTAAGEIPHYKHEGRLLFRADELDLWLSNFKQGERPESASVSPETKLVSPSMATESGTP